MADTQANTPEGPDPVYRGTYEDRDMPDIMADAGIECGDCHVPADHVVRPDVGVCVDCHDEDYAELGEEWADEVTGLAAEVATLIDGLPTSARNRPEVERARRVHADLTRYGARGLHNYELASGLLSEVRRTLREVAETQ